MLKIGDFSRLGQVSVDTLRHYDTLGLLKPAEIDPFTGYRYYSFQQLGRLKRILALKDLGLSLEQIAPMLEGDVSTEQLKGMLKLKQAEINQRIEAEHERLVRVEARLKQIEMESRMPNYEIIIKQVRPQLIASIRRVLPTHTRVIELFEELSGCLMQQGVPQALAITLWHSSGEDEDNAESNGIGEQNVDAEAVITLKTPIAETGLMKVYELAGGSMASTVHNGAYNRLYLAYSALNEWIEANGYRIVGPAREMYHFSQEPLRHDDESYVTELQIPIEKGQNHE